jgi:hypothetical protein
VGGFGYDPLSATADGSQIIRVRSTRFDFTATDAPLLTVGKPLRSINQSGDDLFRT